MNKDTEKVFFEFEHFLRRFPYIRVLMLGQTAKALKEGGAFEEPIQAGIRLSDLTKEVRGVIEEFLPKCERTDKGYMGEIGGVKVFIQVFKQKYTFIENPDSVPWRGESYFIPNNFDFFWTQKNMLE